MTKKIIISIIGLLVINNIYAQWNLSMALQTTSVGLGVKSLSSPKSNVVWASSFDTSGISNSNYYFKSIDGGINWTYGAIATTGGQKDITSISAINKDTVWAALNKHGIGSGFSLLYSQILKTTDGGLNWVIQSSASFTGPTNHINFIHFNNENIGICVGDSNTGYWEIYKTINGGANWNRISSPNIPQNNINEKGVDNCFDIHNNIIWFGTNKGRIYKSLDFGNTWNVFNTGLNKISNIAMRDSLNGLASNGISLIKTTDGGITWSALVYNGIFYKNDITEDKNNPNTYYSAGWETGNIGSSVSIDGGQNWTNIDNMAHTTVNFNNSKGWSGGVTFFGPDNLNYLFFFDLQPTTYLKTNNQIVNFYFYPNPCTNQLSFNSNQLNNYKDVKIEMYNALGMLIQEWNILDNISPITINSEVNGLYLFRVYNKSEYLGSYQIIKK